MSSIASSPDLAAATLQDLGFRALGGFEAWAAAGLPVVRGASRRPHQQALI